MLLLAISMLLATGRAVASSGQECVGESPTAVTRWVWKNRPGLNAPDASRFLASDFLESIRRDAARATQRDEPCAICEGDLWTNSQEGEARPPMTFALAKRDGNHAEVVYAFRFSVEPHQPVEQRTTHIILRKESGCWKIDDMRHGADDSVKRSVKANR
ncbi:hypothetical protein Q4S45_16715 [Massilia sp. R2A-15]|uniref:hypothetical protein n=1 Tax=Massilia sp. R2A-15 TaxID=3064278 RepID=UPI0027346C21|nr:hypothetical protein [Massilia sp. R2A-15]WLI88359.1 hypothetical protein Q4S45_16715 [Massilia sp. R2A-15]